MQEIRSTFLAPALPLAAPRLGRVEALEQGLTPVDRLPPQLAAQHLGYFQAVGADIANLRGLALPDTDALAVEGTLQQAFSTTAEEVGSEAMAAGTSYAKKSKAAEPEKAPGALTDLAERLKKLFPKIDKNKDGVLSPEEINAAMRDPSIRGKDAAALNVLYRIRGQAQWLSRDESNRPYDQNGVSLKDLDRLGKGDLSELNRVTGKDNSQWLKDAEQDYGGFQSRLGRQSQQLFEGMPDPNSVEQGQVGNCFFLAALVALATRDPQAIKNMIKQNPDGSYTVTFPGKPPVTVTALTDSEKAMAAKSNGLWAAVLEKAYAKMTAQVVGSNSMEPGYMGSVETGLDPFSRTRAEGIFLSEHKPQEIRHKLAAAVKAGKLVQAGCLKPALPGLVAGHAYTVLSFDEQSDSLSLRNPWGKTEPGNDGKDDGVFRLTFAQFLANFWTLGIGG